MSLELSEDHFWDSLLAVYTGIAHQTPSTRLVLQAPLLPEPLLPCYRLAPLSSWNRRLAVLERFSDSP